MTVFKRYLPISGSVYTGSKRCYGELITILAKKSEIPCDKVFIGHILFPIFLNTGILYQESSKCLLRCIQDLIVWLSVLDQMDCDKTHPNPIFKFAAYFEQKLFFHR